MNTDQISVILKRFEAPDETLTLQKGRFELVHLGGMTIGRATYEPGWRWSEHVGPGVGATRCSVEHVGLVLAGTATVALTTGGFSSFARVSFSTSRRCPTTVGSSVMSPTCHCTFLVLTITPGSCHPTRPAARGRDTGRRDEGSTLLACAVGWLR